MGKKIKKHIQNRKWIEKKFLKQQKKLTERLDKNTQESKMLEPMVRLFAPLYERVPMKNLLKKQEQF
ncbi:hypothetical protein [Rickettsia endosymbiont of Rhinocyllus conicus]|uniref:hypothetical protein n=1 Tax=Rickettsia endosymbiont of Rhinocyllus conicus TaxID=3066252 RepID=UPI003132FB56